MCCFFVVFSLKAEINNQTLAVLVNVNDPESIEIARYYQAARHIPDAHIIRVKFKKNVNVLTELQFRAIEVQLKTKVSADIQAYALAWRKPWRVGCMSITSAFSLGFEKQYCSKGCKKTKPVKYFNSQGNQPYTDFNIRPSMMLSANTLEGVKRLIDRGVESDYLRPRGTAYLLSTSDKHRNVRSINFPIIKHSLGALIDVDVIKADALKNKQDILFYFTGKKTIKWINENNYLPGSIADHLTSTGGHLFNGSQMSALKWIDAGATGSYGTVVEPCNFLQKFPSPGIVMQKYLSGDRLIEAYWKSVQMPGQGVFVGEPLASPFKGCHVTKNQMGVFHYIDRKSQNMVERQSRNCKYFNYLALK